MEFYADFDGKLTDPNVEKCIARLKKLADKVTMVGTPEVPWFPTQITDFDFIGKRILGSGDGIDDVDHPGFKDEEYRKRRTLVNKISENYLMGDSFIPDAHYTDQEREIWKFCYGKLKNLFKTNACEEFNWSIREFEKNVGFTENDIPQLNPISKFL